MSKTAFDKIMAGLSEAADIAEGRAAPGSYRVHPPAAIDVGAIRKRLGLTQEAFATRFKLPVGTVRDWEQGRRVPETGSLNLLRIIDREPDAAARALEDA